MSSARDRLQKSSGHLHACRALLGWARCGVFILACASAAIAADPPLPRNEPPLPTREPPMRSGPSMPGVLRGSSIDALPMSPAKARVLTMFSQRAVSSTRQFIVYSPDANVRTRVVSFAEELKSFVLRQLGEIDRWKSPILLVLEPPKPETLASQAPGALSLYQNDAGFNLQIDVQIGADPARVNLQRLILRALLVEIAYRDQQDQIKPGTAFTEAPWWLVEGLLQLYAHRESALDPDLFKRIVDFDRLPPLAKFLKSLPSDFAGTVVEEMDQACSMCLVQLLLEQPTGKASLVSLLKHGPSSSAEPIPQLLQDFPALGKDEASLQKWWTVNLARYSASDRYRGLTAQETEGQLNEALRLEIPVPGTTKRQTFPLAEFPEYTKLPNYRPALAVCQSSLVSLSPRANALYGPIIAEYTEIIGQIGRNKTRGVIERIEKVEELRRNLVQRMSAVADYMNWYEASQMPSRSGKFESYMRAARDVDRPPPRHDPLSRFMDEAAKEQR